MKRTLFVAVVASLWSTPAPAQSPTAEQKQATVAWIQTLQKESGGFAADAKPATPATLGATSSAIRAVKYFGGKVARPDAAARFASDCYTKNMSGYAQTPGGKVDVRTTAIGLLAAAEL